MDALTQLFETIKQTPRDWELRLSRTNSHWLGIRRNGRGAPCQCPISSIENLPLCEAFKVGARAGLTEAEIKEVIDAADTDLSHGFDTLRERELRFRLLDACGLLSLLPRDGGKL